MISTNGKYSEVDGVRPEVIKLQLFPFSLRNVAAIWFELFPYG